MSTTQTPPRGSIRCPRCDSLLGPEQDWCLTCGAPARTRLAPRPNWKAPVVLAAVLAAVSVLALAIAFISLTGDNSTTSSTTTTAPTTTTLPGATTAPVIPPVTTTAPAVTTTAPAVTTTAPTLPTAPTTTGTK